MFKRLRPLVIHGRLFTDPLAIELGQYCFAATRAERVCVVSSRLSEASSVALRTLAALLDEWQIDPCLEQMGCRRGHHWAALLIDSPASRCRFRAISVPPGAEAGSPPPPVIEVA
jgi:hypothetical protein